MRCKRELPITLYVCVYNVCDTVSTEKLIMLQQWDIILQLIIQQCFATITTISINIISINVTSSTSTSESESVSVITISIQPNENHHQLFILEVVHAQTAQSHLEFFIHRNEIVLDFKVKWTWLAKEREREKKCGPTDRHTRTHLTCRAKSLFHLISFKCC